MRRVVLGMAVFAIALTSVAFAHGSAAAAGAAGTATVTLPSAQPSPQPSPASTPGLTPTPASTPSQGGGTTPGAGGGTTGPFTGRGGTAAPAPRKASGGAGRITTRWGRTNRSPNVASLLDFGWVNAEWPTARTEDGYGTRVLPLSTLIHEKCFNPSCSDLHCRDFKCRDKNCMREKKPVMVYIYDPMEKRAVKHDREKAMFGGTDDVAALSNFVHCFHMAADEVEARAYRAQFGQQLPALVFLAPNGKTVEVLEGKIRQSEIKKAFKKTLDYSYSLKSGKALKTLDSIHARMEKIEDDIANVSPRVSALEAKIRAQGAHGRVKAQLAKEHKKLQISLTELQKLEAERSALLNQAVTCKPDAVTAAR